MKRGKKNLMIFIAILFILFLIRLYIDHNYLKTTKYEIVSSKIPQSFDGYKIVLLSDLHSKDFKMNIINKINTENPDIIVLAGDMVSANEVNYEVFLKLSEKLSKKYPVYYIKGNHEGELKNENYKVLEDALNVYGIKILDNEKVKLNKNDEYINLYGMWCNQRYYSRADIDKEYVIKKETITKLLGDADKDAYNILLMHTPTFFEAYESWGADLVLSGHMHGGLIRLPYLGGIFSPDRKLFPKYCYGKYKINNSTLIIGGGLSRGETGFRLFNRPEILSITLRNGDD